MKGLNITHETEIELIDILKKFGKYEYHIEVVVNTGALIKTIDNEHDARQTINNIKQKFGHLL